jgi:hypothetical protein
MEWDKIESAPKGGGADTTTDPNWVEPPKILLLFENGESSVGYWDWYYSEGGNGYEGCEAWIEPISGELLCMYYDDPVGWLNLPSALIKKE